MKKLHFLTESKSFRRSCVYGGLFFLLLFFLFYPLDLRVALPGEVRYEHEELLIAREGGFVQHHPGEQLRQLVPGEQIFILHNPVLLFARERLDWMLRYDQLLFEQQRSSRETIGESLLTHRRVKSDTDACRELERRISDAVLSASGSRIFIPELRNVSSGLFIRPGTVLGKLCSGKKVVRAYAGDHEVRLIKKGQRVRLLLRDRLSGFSGSVSEVAPIPVELRNNPVLQTLGGEIPATFDETDPQNSYSVKPVYPVDIVPDDELPGQIGRFVRAEISHRMTAAARIWSLLLSAFRRDVL